MRNVECPCYCVGEGRGHWVARHKTREGHHERDVKQLASLRAKGKDAPHRLVEAVQENALISAGKGRHFWLREWESVEDFLRPEAKQMVANMLNAAYAELGVQPPPKSKAKSTSSSKAKSSSSTKAASTSKTR